MCRGSIATAALGINRLGSCNRRLLKGSTQPGFLYSGGTNTRLRASTEGAAINDSGEVIGPEGNNSFLYSGGTYTQIEYPGSSITKATGINGSGEVAGYYAAGAENINSGFVYSDGTYTRIYFPGSLDTWVMGIDASGDVAGYYKKSHKDEDLGFIYSGGTYTDDQAAGFESHSNRGRERRRAPYGVTTR